MIHLTRRTALIGLCLTPLAVHAQSAEPITFHFYGAENCGPCLAFKRNGLPLVQAAGQELGFAVVENLIARTEDIGQVGIYGAADPLLRQAAAQIERVYPPLFIVTRGASIVFAKEGDWQGAQAAAIAAASAA